VDLFCFKGKDVAGLDKVVYLENRRFLPEDHELRRQCNDFPGKEVERSLPPEQLSNSDIK